MVTFLGIMQVSLRIAFAVRANKETCCICMSLERRALASGGTAPTDWPCSWKCSPKHVPLLPLRDSGFFPG